MLTEGDTSNQLECLEKFMARSDEGLPRSNTLHSSSPISTLPPDVLSLIFQHACTVPDLQRTYGFPELPPTASETTPETVPPEKITQFILSAVSVYWRRVSTLLAPYIWTSLYLLVHPRTINNASAILDAFLTYSGQLPVTIALEFDSTWRHDAKALIDTRSDKVLFQNAHRIRELYLEVLTETWIDFLPCLSDVTHLIIKGLLVHCPHPVVIRSQCSNLTLFYFPHRLNVSISCPELTVLHLEAVPLHFCLEVLATYQNLIEFRVRDVEQPEREETIPKSTFVLPYMEVFEWSVNTEFSTDIALLRHIRMPALKELVWVEDNYTLDIRDHSLREIFFRNLPPTLINFVCICTHRSKVTTLFDCIRDTLNIECVTLRDISGPFLDHVFEWLTPALDLVGGRQRMRLPNLKAVLIKEISEPAEFDQDKVLQMLERRSLCVSGFDREPFRLEFQSEVALLPELELKENIKVKVQSGGQ